MEHNEKRVQFSDALVQHIRLSSVRAYQLAAACDLTPSQLSAWLNRAVPLRPNDPRALRLAELLGIDASTAFQPWTPARELSGIGIECRGRR